MTEIQQLVKALGIAGGGSLGRAWVTEARVISVTVEPQRLVAAADDDNSHAGLVNEQFSVVLHADKIVSRTRELIPNLAEVVPLKESILHLSAQAKRFSRRLSWRPSDS
jgi:hypothetical protein